MTFKDDIIERLRTDFGENADKATTMLFDAISKVDYLKTDRLIRCIIFLAKGDLAALHIYIEAATIDPRDITLWAEYDDLNFKKLHDFNNTFEECATNAKE
jgi:galactose-1-phosphate uridylyltransferase